MLTLTLSRGSLLDSCRKEAEEKKSGCGHVGNLPGGAPRVIRCTLLKLRVYCLAPFAYEASTHRPTLHLVDHVTQGKSFASTTVLCALPFISWELPELSSSSWEAEGRELISLSLSHTLTFTHTHTPTQTHTTHIQYILSEWEERRDRERRQRGKHCPALHRLCSFWQGLCNIFFHPFLFLSFLLPLQLLYSCQFLCCLCVSVRPAQLSLLCQSRWQLRSCIGIVSAVCH